MSARGKTLSDVSKKGVRLPEQHIGQPELSRPEWRWHAFIASHVVAALLIASWIMPPFEGMWAVVDELLFKSLNGSLEASRQLQVFWAAANHRSVDLVSGTLTTLLVLWWLRSETRDVQNWRCAMLGAVAIPVILAPFFAHWVLEQVFYFERPSPTLVYKDALRLTELVPDLATKDASRYSFPGDHAFVLFSILIFFVYFRAFIPIVVSVVFAVIFMLPRLVAGAHWLTDNIMGGAVPALVITAWVLATPFGYWLAKVLLPVVGWFAGLMPSWLLASKPG